MCFVTILDKATCIKHCLVGFFLPTIISMGSSYCAGSAGIIKISPVICLLHGVVIV